MLVFTTYDNNYQTWNVMNSNTNECIAYFHVLILKDNIDAITQWLSNHPEYIEET